MAYFHRWMSMSSQTGKPTQYRAIYNKDKEENPNRIINAQHNTSNLTYINKVHYNSNSDLFLPGPHFK